MHNVKLIQKWRS